jgi:glutaredoxin-like protein NrdH
MDPITVSTTGPACMQCTLTKTALDRAGLDFEEIDLRTHPRALEHLRDDLGHTQAPVVVAGPGEHWSGFQPDRIHRLAADHTPGT